MRPLIQPQVNLNGTSREELVRQLQEVTEKLDAVIRAMAQAQPHGRDYQLRPDEFAHAQWAWADRWQVLEELHAELTQHGTALATGGQHE